MVLSPRVLRILGALLLCAALLPAQVPCPRCRGEGLVPCRSKQHDSRRVCGTALPHRCDVLLRASCCHGIGKVPCQTCKDPGARARLEEDLEAGRQWVRTMIPVDRVAGGRMIHVETAHFLIHFSIPRWRTKSRTLKRVKAAHLFAERLEEAAKTFKEVTGLLPEKRQTLFLVATSAENRKVTKELFGLRSDFALKYYGLEGRACQWPTPPDLVADQAFHGHVVHNATHLLANAVIEYRDKLPWWLDMGLAHWIESRRVKRCVTFCHLEGLPSDRWEKGEWRKMIRDDLRGKAETRLAALLQRSPESMRYRDHAYAWSYVDFLINAHRKKLPALLRAVKASPDTRKAVADVLGWDLDSFQGAWREYVLKRYRGV